MGGRLEINKIICGQRKGVIYENCLMDWVKRKKERKKELTKNEGMKQLIKKESKKEQLTMRERKIDNVRVDEERKGERKKQPKQFLTKN